MNDGIETAIRMSGQAPAAPAYDDEHFDRNYYPDQVAHDRETLGGGGPGDTYPAPAHGWTCFHCGETFKGSAAAALHFGAVPSREPACLIKGERGLLMALRDAEQERDEWKSRAIALRCGVDEDDVVRRLHATRGTLKDGKAGQ